MKLWQKTSLICIAVLLVILGQAIGTRRRR